MEKILEQEQTVSDAISPQSIPLSQHVRVLASDLRAKAEGSPLAADTLILSSQVDGLCDYVEHLHESVETLLAMIDEVGTSAAGKSETDISAKQEKAMEIQREIHEFKPTLKRTIKALFMWRDSPEERLRNEN